MELSGVEFSQLLFKVKKNRKKRKKKKKNKKNKNNGQKENIKQIKMTHEGKQKAMQGKITKKVIFISSFQLHETKIKTQLNKHKTTINKHKQNKKGDFMIVGGHFNYTNSQGTVFAGIARYSISQSQWDSMDNVLTTDCSTNDTVYSLVSTNKYIIAGGSFTTV
jgi:hypothetical protein